MRTLHDALPANAAQRIRNFHRRLRYQQRIDRPKVWPRRPLDHYRRDYRQPDAVVEQWCATLAHPESTAAYVTAWTHLNHLLEA
jgi:hypothetical protein